MIRNTKETLLSSMVQTHLIVVPAGGVEMRDDRTKEKWTVPIATFMLAKFPVTQAFYREVMQASPSMFKGDQKPVETVSWLDAIEFCNTLSERCGLQASYTRILGTGEIAFDPEKSGFRLPTEAEWQYACQAGSAGIRYGDLNEIAWYKANAQNGTQDVGRKAPNDWGLYDMLGNVWEWCSDIYDEEVYGSYRIFRGGGWCDEERSVMATTRRRSHPTSFKIDDLGFRVAKNA